MPPAGAAIGAIAVAVTTAATGIAAGIAVTTAVVTGLVMGALSLGLSMVSMALAPKPKMPSLGGRNVQVRQPITPWQLPYGWVRLSGPITFIEGTNGNQRFHLVITLSADLIDGFDFIQLNDYPIYPEMLDANGVVTMGKFANKVRIKMYVGDADQTADPDLMAETSATTSDRGRGRAYIYVRYLYDPDLFPGAIPNLSAWVRGKRTWDPRTGSNRWTLNPTLFLADYMVRPRALGGMGVLQSDISSAELLASANVNEEFVARKSVTLLISSIDLTNNILIVTSKTVPLIYGDRVTVVASYANPGNLTSGANFYVVPKRPLMVLQGQSNTILPAGFQLASSLNDAFARTVVSISHIGSGQVTVTQNAELRYGASGLVILDQEPAQIIDNIRAAMAGRVYYIGGEWIFRSGAYVAPVRTVTEPELRKGPSLVTKVPLRQRFNAVKGTHFDPFSGWQPTDYPTIVNTAYQLQDGGTRNYADLDLPFTISKTTAQRIAKIELERARREKSLKWPGKLTLLDIQGGDAIYVNLDRFGFVNKEFEVQEYAVVTDEDEDGIPYYAVDLQLQEYDSGIFNWSSLEEATLSNQPDINLPDPFNPLEPGVPMVVEVLYDTRGSAGVKSKATVSWIASMDEFVVLYFLEYRNIVTSVWTVLPGIATTTTELFDLEPGFYDFRVRAQNALGVYSEYSEIMNKEITGLLAPPTAPQNMTVQGMGGLAVVRWDQSPDLDVLTGGFFEFRHSSAQTGATWEESVSIGNQVPGSETVGIFPLKPGTYLGKAVDSSGIRSLVATSVVSDGETTLGYTTLNTIVEEPLFLGSHSNTAVADGQLKLAGSGSFDAIPDLDAVLNLDSYGGIALSGTYGFATIMDLGTQQRVRVRTTLTVLIVNLLDLIDDRTDNIDTWENFDGTGAASGDCQVWARATNDDPSGSPSWSAYNRVDSAEFNARALQFEARLTTNDPAYNILVSTLQVTASQIA